MTPRDLLVRQPGILVRSGIVAAGLVATLLVGHIHTWTGLAYEFHVFFILPVLVVGWFSGKWAGYGVALLAIVEWFIADRSLAGDQADVLPLIFNTVMRLTIFLFGAWLIAEMRHTLLRESRLAREDALTRLPNRRELYERERQVFAQAQRQGTPLTAVFIDLDRFKEVNDQLGYDSGDALLIAVARIIRESVRASDVLGRIGGDEFAILLLAMNSRAALAYVEKLRKRLLMAMKEKSWPVTFSIGVASYKAVPQDFEVMLKQADALMYDVKRGNRDRILQQEF